jgi:hypothetical protein
MLLIGLSIDGECTSNILSERRGSILRASVAIVMGGVRLRYTGVNKGFICRYNLFSSLLKASALQGERSPIQPSAWKGCPPQFGCPFAC